MKRLTIAIGAVLVLGGTYVVADAYDLTPGVLTMRPLDPEPQPYPTVSPLGGLVEELPAWDESAPLPDSAAISAATDSFLANDMIAGRASVVVQDALTGEVLASHDPEVPRTPASNMKVLTAVVALKELGAETTLPTSTSLSGTSLYLVGGGDTLLTEGAGDDAAINGHAGLADLADATVAEANKLGVTSVDLVVDSTLFAEPLYATTIDGPDTGYVMAMRPIAVNQSRNENRQYTADPDLQAGYMFADALAERGITVVSVNRGEEANDAKALAQVHSAPVRDLVEFMMTESDNTTAEVLGHLVAISRGKPADFVGAGEATIEVLADLGVDTSQIVVADNSGLSVPDRVTTRVLVDIFAAIYKGEHPELAALPSALPVGSYSGTLSDRMAGTEAQGRIRAKTGTLVTVTSLSGFLETGDGRLLIFAVVVDNVEEGVVAEARGVMDTFVVALAAS